jgi:23S rRNA pseudouridine1911/1915/1917 synthase
MLVECSVSEQLPIFISVAPEDAGKRLDQFLVSQLPGLSRARVQQLITEQKVVVNGSAAKASFRLRGSERIAVLSPQQAPPLRAIPEQIPLDIVYEDDDLGVVNKPAGMMVHAGAGATEDERNKGTLVNALLHRFGSLSGLGGELRPGIVHRLDRATSGLIVFAKNDLAHRRLASQFSRRKVKKTYIAMVHGWLKQNQGTVTSGISRDRVRRTRMTTRRQGGREAITHYQVRRRLDSPYGKFSLLEVKIETGRTHQIRVHLTHLGFPLAGDDKYGDFSWNKTLARQGLKRMFLHSWRLSLPHPLDGRELTLESPLPSELASFVARLDDGQLPR